jgi:hypothetical protein
MVPLQERLQVSTVDVVYVQEPPISVELLGRHQGTDAATDGGGSRAIAPEGKRQPRDARHMMRETTTPTLTASPPPLDLSSTYWDCLQVKISCPKHVRFRDDSSL